MTPPELGLIVMTPAKACMHAFYTQATDGSKNDMLLVKERVRDKTGNETVNIRFIENFKREYYVTKKQHRHTHTTKKEFESFENLDTHLSTQAHLASNIARSLGMRSKGYVRMAELRESPYLYGTDISTTSLVKKQYKDRYPNYNPDATVAIFDLETNVFSERGEILCGAVTMKDKVILALTEDYVKDIPTPVETIQKAFDVYLKEVKEKRNITLYVKIAKNDLGVVRTIMGSLHKLKPDYAGAWNMAFDIGKILECLDYYGVDPKDIFCDPSVPPAYRRFDWRKAEMQKVTASGKTMSKHMADLWHVVDAPASFYMIDPMCFFKINRVAEQARNSYSLDAILNEELNLGKLRFTEADEHSGLEWHKVMQTKYKVQYGIYNIFDCIGVEMLDEKTKDISQAVNARLDITDPKNLISGPKNLANALDGFLKKRGAVVSATAPNMTEEFDALTMDPSNIIITLASELLAVKGTDVISDMPGCASRIFTNVADVDIKSGYPTVGSIANIARHTRLTEICAIEGLSDISSDVIGDEDDHLPDIELRTIAIDITALRTNAIDLGVRLYNLPTMQDLLSDYLKDST